MELPQRQYTARETLHKLKSVRSVGGPQREQKPVEARRAHSSNAEPMLPLHDHPTAIMAVLGQKWQWDVGREATPGYRHRRSYYAHAVRPVQAT